MNRTEIKKIIKQCKDICEGEDLAIDIRTKKIEQLKQQLATVEEGLRRSKESKINNHNMVVYHEALLKEETDCKRKVTNLIKKYSALHLDDESDHSVGERGTYLWLYCGLFDEHNEEDDPYYDFHYMDDWAECLERCETYIGLIEETREVA